ncbi:MAG: autotransporter-associated beta strand repeat-containing protein [Akkermansia sp.]|nr:autotransporter-associated beta strand repeat-containing protein [Akkermansia sp.]
MKPTSPCVSLLLSILATVAGITTASASETYSADGVNLENILESTRFYDTDKGLYWEVVGQPYDGARQLYNQTGSFAFMGDLSERMLPPTPQFKDAFDNLVNDGNSCWYCVGANILQYWESYYGVFYKGKTPLPYGYTYDTANLSTLAGTQSLDLHMFFYDNWTQEDRSGYAAGGDAEMAAVWYLATGKNIRADKARYSQLVDGAAEAGFFSEYFTENAASREAYYIGGDATDLISATDFMREAFGLDRNGNRETYGQIAYLGILNKAGQGHALSCYGFTTGADGQLESLYLTNSDDKEYRVFQVYVGLDGQGYLHLYNDAAHTKDWDFLGGGWNISDITYINTPTVLKEMYDEYTHAALTWTGTPNGVWSDKDAALATTEELPGDQAGWKVYAMDGYYNSYYQAGRAVEFSDLADKTSVSLQGKLSAPELLLGNNTKAYSFTGSTGATLSADAITKRGGADAAFSKVAITAGTVDVGMGALSLEQGSKLTAQTGVVDNMGTLRLNGGSASFSSGLTVRDSGTLAVNAAAALTTTLNLEAGSSLFLNLGTGNKTSQLLTLTGSLNVLGDCYLIVNENALTSGQNYILTGVSGSITGWENIITNCGSITLNGKQLVLSYTNPGALTWDGGDNTWSAGQWNGGTDASNGKDLTFSRTGSTVVTVVGEVSPHSMHFARGEFQLKAGDGAAITACRTITLAENAKLTSDVALAGADISMSANSTLTLGPKAATVELGGLEMAAGSTLALNGSTRYTVAKAGALGGSIQLNNTASLQLNSATDTEIYGSFAGNANTELAFLNSSAKDSVTFYLGADSSAFNGSIAIGSNDGTAPATTLRMDSATRNFTVNKSGELSLRGKGDISGRVNGTGTLTIEHNATYQLAPGGTAAFGSDILLNVAGTARIGTEETPLTTDLPEKVTVSGELTTYYKSTSGGKTLKLGELTLQDGGSYTLVHTERTLYSGHTIDKLAVDGGGSITNSIIDVETEVNPQFRHDIIVNTLSGSGTLDLETSSDLYVTKLTIKDTASGGYGGDIIIHNPHYNKMEYYANYDHGQVVEMQSGTVNGVVHLEAHGMVSDKQVPYGLAGFGLGGDITVGGLDDTESSKTTYLYSGSYSAACATKDMSHLFDNNIAPEKHTLTINAAEDYEFHGKVFAWLSLAKQGGGTQVFSGDTSLFEGGLRVDAGELVFENAIYSADSVTLNDGTLRLHGGKLAGLGGSGGTLALDAAADGSAYTIDLTGSTGSYAVQLNSTTARVTASGTFGGSITTTGTSGITVDSGKQVTLQSAITNTGTLTLKGTIDASNLELTQNSDTHVDTKGKLGASGFAKAAGASVTIVNGGPTVNNGATITHKDLQQSGTLTLRTNGTAGFGGEVNYTTYLLTGSDSASVSDITRAAGGSLRSIQVEGGTLTVDAASDLVTATGGMLKVTYAGTLGAVLSGTAALTTSANVTINRANTHSGTTTVSGGTLHIGNKAALGTGAVTLSGGTLEIAANGFTNAITSTGTSGITVASGSTLALQGAIANTGTLTLKGAFDASALKLDQGEGTRVDINGRTGNSGFAQSGAYSITLVNGGTSRNGGATITHSGAAGKTFTLGTDGRATASGVVDYASYLLTGTDTANVAAINSKAGSALTSIDVEGGTLTVDTATNLISATGGTLNITTTGTVGGTARDTAITAAAGTLNTALSGRSAITKTGSGMLTINAANTHSGATTVSGGTLKITNKDALGSGEVKLSGGTLTIAANGFTNTISAAAASGITVAETYTLNLKQALRNTGNLTLKGAFDASALELLHDDSTHVDINGKTGANGFTKTSSYSVTIVDGGTTNGSGAAITHTGLQEGKLTLGTDGKATYGGTVDYTSYLLTGNATASVSAITNAAGGKLQAINMTGGKLTVDVSTDKLGSISGNAELDINPDTELTINHANNDYTGETWVFSGGTLKVGDAHALGTGTVHLSCGTLEIADGGFSNKISTSCSGSVVSVARGETLRMQQTISNEGTLTLKGAFDASALTLVKGGSTHVDINGKTGASGFTKTGGASVTIVNGGTTRDGGATISHKDLAAGETLKLGANGVATSGGTVDYTSYLLTGTDTANVAAINQQAGGKLTSIEVKGGTLTVDAATNLITATGGALNITTAGAVGGTARNTAVTASAGTLNTALSGTSSLTTKGNVTINNANTYTSGTTVQGGTLRIGNKGALGTGAVTLGGGTLEIAAGGFANTVTASGTSGITVTNGNTLTLTKALANSGTLTLKGAFDASALTLVKGGSTHVDINGKTGASGFTKTGGASVTIVNGGTTRDGGATISHKDLAAGETLKLGANGVATSGGTVDYTSYLLTGTDTANVAAINQQAGGKLTSIEVKGGTLTVDAATNLITATGGALNITTAGAVGGTARNTAVTASAGTLNTALSGTSSLTTKGNVTINNANTYTSGTTVQGGTLRIGNKGALGTGAVTLGGGTLEIAAGGFANTVTASGTSGITVTNGNTLTLTKALANSGTLTLKGAFDASALTLSDGETTHVDVNGKTGASGFAKTGGRSVTIVNGGTTKNGGTTITHSGLKSGEKLTLGTDGKATTGDGVVDFTSFLLTGTDSASVSAITKAAGGKLTSIDVQGGTLVMDAATDKLTVAGGTLDIQEGLGSSVSLADTCDLTKTGAGTLTIAKNSTAGSGSITLKEGSLNLNGKDISSKSVTVTGAAALTSNGGTVKALTLATAGGADGRNGELLYAEELKLTGNLKTAGLTLTKGNITGGSITATGASTMQQGYIGTGITGTTLTKTGDKRMELGGKNKFTGGVTVQQGALALLEKSGMDANITVNSGASLFTAITVNGDITLQNDATMRLRPDASYTLNGHAMTANAGAEFYGDLKTATGSTLTLGLATSAGDAFTVHGDLTIAGGSLGYTGSISQGTPYTLVTATGSITNSSGKTLNELFNLATGTYTINNTGTAITLQKSGVKSVALERMAGGTVPAMGGEIVEAPVTETLVAGVADALVQSDWGIVDAQRAFTGSLNGRHQSLRALGTGRTAVWAGAIGSHTRQSSAHGHAGSDNTLYGAALGVDFNAGEHGAAGVAIGHTWNRVNTFGMNRVKQDTQHAGAFGRARVFSRGANSLWLEAAAGYGKTDSRGTLGYSRERWTQNSGTLTVHANDVMYISETTALNYFGGLEYTATDSGSIDNVRTGSVQNLRGEIGAGVTHAIGHGMVFAEAAVTGDMVRHNPTADVDMRRGGANPGRIGASITVGGAYAISNHWSVNATYSFEGAKHNNSHNAGIGATLRF